MDLTEVRKRQLLRTELGLAIEDCFYTALVDGLARDTVKTYRNSLIWLLMQEGVTTLAGLTPQLLRRAAVLMLDDRAPHRNSKGGEARVRQLFCAVHYLERWAKRQGIAMPDLADLKSPRLPERVQKRVTAEEFRAMEEAVHHRRRTNYSRFTQARDLALLSFLGDTALRIHEVAALNLDDVDLDHGTVIVRRGKGGRGRALSILDADPGAIGGGPTIALLRAYLAERAHRPNAAAQPAFWLSAKGVRFSREALFRVMKRISEAAGLPSTRPVHSFRRASFTEQYNADPTSLPVLAARMGWSSLESNMIGVYTRGATVDLARNQPRPSIARKWRGGPALVTAAAPVTSQTRQKSAAAQHRPQVAWWPCAGDRRSTCHVSDSPTA